MKDKSKLGGGKTGRKKEGGKRKRVCKTKRALVKAIHHLKKKYSKKKKGTGCYLKPYKGGGSKKKKFKLPNQALSNTDLVNYVLELKVPNFRGVFMRDNLPFKIYQIENGIVNLDSFRGKGTYWVCYHKISDNIFYFDSYGNLGPPPELIDYFK